MFHFSWKKIKIIHYKTTNYACFYIVPTIVEHKLGLKMMTAVSSTIESFTESSDSLENDLLATPDSFICSLNDKLSYKQKKQIKT